MKALIDTCIIIDALQSREPFKNDAESIFLRAANKQFDGFITAKSFVPIYQPVDFLKLLNQEIQ